MIHLWFIVIRCYAVCAGILFELIWFITLIRDIAPISTNHVSAESCLKNDIWYSRNRCFLESHLPPALPGSSSIDRQTARSSHRVDTLATHSPRWTLVHTCERDTRIHSRRANIVTDAMLDVESTRLKVTRDRTISAADFPRDPIDETFRLNYRTWHAHSGYVTLTFSLDEMCETIDDNERDDATSVTAGRET